MKAYLRKIGFIVILMAMLTPVALTLAQDDLFDPLSAIKRELESEGIEVVDYSREKSSAWGNLSQTLIDALYAKGITNLSHFIVDEDAGEVMTRSEIENEIKDAQIDVNGVKMPLSALPEDLEKAVNLIELEMKFISEYKPWGNLPETIYETLENEGYENLEGVQRGIELAIDNSRRIVEREIEQNRDTLTEKEKKDMIKAILTPEEWLEGVGLQPDEISQVLQEIFREGSQINAVIMAVAKVLRNLLGAFAVFWIVVSGVQLVMVHGDENVITEQKRSITYAVIGLIAIILMERLVVLIYGIPGAERGLITKGTGLRDEIYGLLTFVKALIGSVAILMIIVSGLKTIGAQGEEEKITTQRKTLLWIGLGLIIIVINQVVVENLYALPVEGGEDRITSENVNNVIRLIGRLAQFALGFTGLIAFAILIYGAGTMVANYGQDEMVENSKKIIKNAIIGIVIVISAFTLVTTVIL
jgi:hypothetical protein